MLIFNSIKEFYNSLQLIDNLSSETKYIIQSSLRKCRGCNIKRQLNYKIDIVTLQLFPTFIAVQDLNLIKSYLSTNKIQVKNNNKVLVEF